MAAQQQQQQQQQRWLKDLALARADVQLLASQNIHSARDLLVQTPVDLMERLNIPLSHAQRILQDAARDVAPPFTTALTLHSTLHQHSVKLLTGLPALDAALRIGVPPAAITELVGPASVGKSQFCYTLALQVVLPQALGGLGRAVLYLDTEGKISVERVREMVEARVAAADPAAIAAAAAAIVVPSDSTAAAVSTGLPAGFSPAQDVLDRTLNRLLIVSASTLDELNSWMARLEQMVAQHDVKLIVLDSIAALLRTEFGGGEAAALAARGEALGQHASALKAAAEAARIPVVVTNQVTAKMTGPAVHSFQHTSMQPPPHPPTAALHNNSTQQQQQQPGGGGSNAHLGSSSDGQVSAALGTKWAHAVNVRLILERRGDSRVVTIAKSPLSANTAVQYVITAAGVQQAPDVAPGHAAVEWVAPFSAVNMPIENAPPGG